MKSRKLKANVALLLANLFRLPSVVLAIACLLMIHTVYFVIAECFCSYLPVTSETRTERNVGRAEACEAIIETVHEYGREAAAIIWAYFILKALFNLLF